jgi:hypothetical protein
MSPLLTFLVRVDQVVFAVITLGRALPGETISAAAWQGERNGKIMGRLARPVIDWLLRPLQRDHCHQAWLWQRDLYL